MRFFKHKRAGYNLMEVLVGITVLIVGIVSVLSLTMKLIKTQDYIKHKEVAILLSQNGLEAVKSKLENNLERCKTDFDPLLDVWNCVGEVSPVQSVCNQYDGYGNCIDWETVNSCVCSSVFAEGNYYQADFNGQEWAIQGTAFSNRWKRIYYICPGFPDPCYYSTLFLSGYSENTIFERKIGVEEAKDYNSDSYEDMIKISSVVRWIERGEYKYVTTTSEFYNWRWRKK